MVLECGSATCADSDIASVEDPEPSATPEQGVGLPEVTVAAVCLLDVAISRSTTSTATFSRQGIASARLYGYGQAIR